MLQSEIRKVIELLDYETRRKELRKEFHEHGVRFYDIMVKVSLEMV